MVPLGPRRVFITEIGVPPVSDMIDTLSASRPRPDPTVPKGRLIPARDASPGFSGSVREERPVGTPHSGIADRAGKPGRLPTMTDSISELRYTGLGCSKQLKMGLDSSLKIEGTNCRATAPVARQRIARKMPPDQATTHVFEVPENVRDSVTTF
jgi:hypothetical protein